MLDPSILVGHGTVPAQVHPGVPDAQAAIERASQAEAQARSMAAAVELLTALDTEANLDDAAQRAARLLCEVLAASRVMILWRSGPRRGLSVIADTRQRGEENLFAEYRLATAAGEEVAARDAPTHWTSVDSPDAENVSPLDRHALLAVAQLARDLSVHSVVANRLSDSTGQERGAVFAIEPARASSIGFINAVATPLGSKLNALEQLEPKVWESAIRSAIELARGSQRNLILTIVIVLGVIMLLPVRYRVKATLELQPVQHRFIAAPVDGPLESARVRPGDLVEKGDLLATINPREIEYELASIRAELNQATQEKKGLMAEHDFAGSKIAALDSDRLRLQSELLQYRRDNLEIRSPISGIVASGDLKESEGKPMSRGETMFEIAPLGQMVVEIAVPEEDVAHVRKGMQTDFYVHAIPGRTMRGTIERLHPRAELRDHDNVYIAEVQIEDPVNVLRPGMRGRAKIFSDRHAFGWNLFHKAYYALCNVVGW